MKDNGKMIKNKETEHNIIQMVINIQDNIKMTKKMEMGYSIMH